MLAHAADASGWGMLAFIPVGFLLLVGLFLVLRPVVTGIVGTEEQEEADDLASQLLGADEARELRRKARRRRALRRLQRRAYTASTTSTSSSVSPNGSTRRTSSGTREE
jgi:hypothetical protein